MPQAHLSTLEYGPSSSPQSGRVSGLIRAAKDLRSGRLWIKCVPYAVACGRTSLSSTNRVAFVLATETPVIIPPGLANFCTHATHTGLGPLRATSGTFGAAS